MSKLRAFGLLPLILLCLVFGVSSAKASPIVITYTGNSALGNPVNVEADIDLTSMPGHVLLTLKNKFVNPTDAAQNLSGFSFALNSGQNSGTLVSGTTSTLVTIHSKTTFPIYLAGTFNAGWVMSSTTVNAQPGIKLDDLVGTGHAGPAHTLIGSAGGTGKYSNANGSLTNGAHNPFMWETADWDITVTGNTPTGVDAVTFWFGTGEGTDGITIIPNTGVIPEPSSIALSGIGCVGLLGFWAAARRKVAAAA